MEKNPEMAGRQLSVQVMAGAAGSPAGGAAAAAAAGADTTRLTGSPLSYAERRARRAARSSAKQEASRRFRQHLRCLVVGSTAMLGFLRRPEISSLASAHLFLAPLRGSVTTRLSQWLAPLQRLASCQHRYIMSDRGGGGGGDDGLAAGTTAATSAMPRTISPAQLSSLCRRGFVVVDEFVSSEDIEAARRRILDDESIAWRIPTNSRGTRDDKIAWLTDTAAAVRGDDDGESGDGPALLAAEQGWFRNLRAQLCSCVHLTTTSAETERRSPDEFQLAVYRTGAHGYTRHLDAEESIMFPEAACSSDPPRPPRSPQSPQSPRPPQIKRVVTAVLYLNARDISADIDGGELRLWPPACSRDPDESYSKDQEHATTYVIDVPPRGGTLVLFLSGAVPHQVRKIKRGAAPRIALTAWFHGSARTGPG